MKENEVEWAAALVIAGAITLGLLLASGGELVTFLRYSLAAVGLGAAGIVLLSAAVLALQWLKGRLP